MAQGVNGPRAASIIVIRANGDQCMMALKWTPM
jgi:hypothetical protein